MAISVQTLDSIAYLIEDAGLQDKDLTRDRILEGLQTEIYGPIFAEIVNYAKELVGKGHYNVLPMSIGLEIAGSLYSRANSRYLTQDHVLAGDELAAFQAQVLAGDLPLVDLRFATTHSNAIDQLIQADRALRGDDIGIQASLAAANYGAIFGPQTMTSGSRITAKLDGGDSPYELDQASYDGMTHLDTSNVIIGNIVEGVVRHSTLVHSGKQRIRIFDIGSGHGATLAAVLHSIAGKNDTSNLPAIAVTGIEATPTFYDELYEFANGPYGASALRLNLGERSTENNIPSQFGEVHLVRGNAPSIIDSMVGLPINNKDETTIVVANYVFHRLPSDKKAAIIARFAQLENVILIIGDLRQDTSEINCRDFNLAANGPLNTGNLILTAQMAKAGFEVIDPADAVPASIDKRLAPNILGDSLDPRRDGHLFLAVKGERALASLSLVSTGPDLTMTRHDNRILVR